MPKTNFEFNLSPYTNYRGSQPPAIEIEKYHMTLMAQQAIENGDYSYAASIKRKIAGICHWQGNQSDAHLLETDAYRLELRAHNVDPDISVKTQRAIETGDYKRAAQLKRIEAKVCRALGGEDRRRDAHWLEVDADRLEKL